MTIPDKLSDKKIMLLTVRQFNGAINYILSNKILIIIKPNKQLILYLLTVSEYVPPHFALLIGLYVRLLQITSVIDSDNVYYIGQMDTALCSHKFYS